MSRSRDVRTVPTPATTSTRTSTRTSTTLNDTADLRATSRTGRSHAATTSPGHTARTRHPGAASSGGPDHPTSQAPRPRPRRGLANGTRPAANRRAPLSTDVRIALRTCGPRVLDAATPLGDLNQTPQRSDTADDDTRPNTRPASETPYREGDDNGCSDLNAGTNPEPGDRARKAHRRTYRFTYRPMPRSMSRRWRCGRYTGRDVGV